MGKKFVLDPKENKGTGFYGKWAYYNQKKREWLKEQEQEKDDQKKNKKGE